MRSLFAFNQSAPESLELDECAPRPIGCGGEERGLTPADRVLAAFGRFQLLKLWFTAEALNCRWLDSETGRRFETSYPSN
jgi:hypothetical protein